MDIARPNVARQKRRKRWMLASAGVVVLAGITLAISRLKPAPPSVNSSSVWIGSVHRGNMVIQVRGLGKLVPKNILFIPADSDARVIQRLVEPGAAVKPGTRLLILSNPTLEQAAVSARFQVAETAAGLRQLQADLESKVLAQEQATAVLQDQWQRAEARAASDQTLLGRGLVAAFTARQDRKKAASLALQLLISRRNLTAQRQSMQAQLIAEHAKLQALRTLYRLKQTQVNELQVRAGAAGVLQDLPVQVGQWVTAGAILAKVARPDQLKARIQIAETQARDVALGQSAVIDTHNGLVPGQVTRISPMVSNGTVRVDVALRGPLPPGARPDLSVEGTIRLARLNNVIYLGRPADARRDSTVGLFKIQPDGTALRVPVRLGATSVDQVQILRGLRPGDRVILSDMSAWDSYNRIRLHS